ncbi:unnamed protein product [Chondrus crispus]|uniref:Uncharacterized protein n=1 Tax=Chondrus crispus TaxID=2769 RepID=R7QGG6_CHOCR|nr:unnamed protein product [Chondrus crispus]CDF37617.1 unnamed protein product [Chondrus crispus]|eukprot:XP_005717488.1 unnamed protein product [Chondrus crispus]
MVCTCVCVRAGHPGCDAKRAGEKWGVPVAAHAQRAREAAKSGRGESESGRKRVCEAVPQGQRLVNERPVGSEAKSAYIPRSMVDTLARGSRTPHMTAHPKRSPCAPSAVSTPISLSSVSTSSARTVTARTCLSIHLAAICIRRLSRPVCGPEMARFRRAASSM